MQANCFILLLLIIIIVIIIKLLFYITCKLAMHLHINCFLN